MRYLIVLLIIIASCTSPEIHCTDSRYTKKGFLFQNNLHYNEFVKYESDDLQIGKIYLVKYKKCGSSVCIIFYSPAKYGENGIIGCD